MAKEVKYNTAHHAGPDAEARIAARLKNSGSPEADTVVQTGNSARRTFTNIHHGGTARHIAILRSVAIGSSVAMTGSKLVR
jgi:hypothetical protein